MAGWESNPATPQPHCRAAGASLASGTAPAEHRGTPEHMWAHLSTSGHTCALPPTAQGTRAGHPAPRVSPPRWRPRSPPRTFLLEGVPALVAFVALVAGAAAQHVRVSVGPRHPAAPARASAPPARRAPARAGPPANGRAGRLARHAGRRCGGLCG